MFIVVAVIISQFWILVILTRMQTSFGLNVEQRTYSSGGCATEYYSCSHSLLRPEMPSEVWCCGLKLFNYLNVEALDNIRSLYM